MKRGEKSKAGRVSGECEKDRHVPRGESVHKRRMRGKAERDGMGEWKVQETVQHMYMLMEK